MDDSASPIKELIAKCKKGNEQAWHDLLDYVSPIIFMICKQKRLTREQTFDIFGQVSLQLVTNIKKLINPDAITSYIRTITIRQIFDLFRKNKQNEDIESEIEVNLATDIESHPDRQFELKEQQIIVHDALLSLSKKDYELLYALFMDKSDPSYDEISARLNMPVSSIGPSRARSLQKLHKELKKRKFKF